MNIDTGTIGRDPARVLGIKRDRLVLEGPTISEAARNRPGGAAARCPRAARPGRKRSTVQRRCRHRADQSLCQVVARPLARPQGMASIVERTEPENPTCMLCQRHLAGLAISQVADEIETKVV